MTNRSQILVLLILVSFATVGAVAQHQPAALRLDVGSPFKFVAYGDIRFANPADKGASDFARRNALVQKIAEEKPAFITITGDLVLNGDQTNWQYWDKETQVWREAGIPVEPALGNHDIRGGVPAINNYMARFPDLKGSRWYTVRAGNLLLIALDTTGDGVEGPQQAWLNQQLDTIPSDVDFVVFNFHHPPYTRSHDIPNGGHSARPQEQKLARMLEARQKNTRARFIVFTGHVHNYERYERGGVMYVVSGGGGAKPYTIPRDPTDFYTDDGPTYHYCVLEVDKGKLNFGMYKLDLDGSKAKFSKRDSFELVTPQAAGAKAAKLAR